MNKKTDFNLRNSEGNNPLMYSLRFNYSENLIKLFFDKNTDVN